MSAWCPPGLGTSIAPVPNSYLPRLSAFRGATREVARRAGGESLSRAFADFRSWHVEDLPCSLPPPPLRGSSPDYGGGDECYRVSERRKEPHDRHTRRRHRARGTVFRRRRISGRAAAAGGHP